MHMLIQPLGQHIKKVEGSDDTSQICSFVWTFRKKSEAVRIKVKS